jgi:alpha-tubulin suppressor-like RCC1 family protein
MLTGCLGKQPQDGSSSQAFAPLSINPKGTSVPIGRQVTFQGQAGIPPYQYFIESGGGTIDQNSGLYTAPAATGIAVVDVIDSEKSHSIAVVTITPQFIVSPANMLLTVTSSIGFTAVGGTAPYTYSIIPPSGPPVFDSLNNVYIGLAGKINATTGAFQAVTPGSDVVEVTDANGLKERAVATVYAKPQISPLFPSVAFDGRLVFTTTGGTPALTYAVIAGGACPVPGTDCFMNPTTGAFRGSTVSGTITVKVTDSLAFTSQTTVQVYHPSEISTGQKHSCFLDISNGRIKCWGDNFYGQLGLGLPYGTNPTLDPVTSSTAYINLGLNSVAAQMKAIEVASGRYHTCSILTFNAATSYVKCWGDNTRAQLGIGLITGFKTIVGDEANEMAPNISAAGGTIANVGTNNIALSLSLGESHSCAIVKNTVSGLKNVHCWGDNTYGQAGIGINTGVNAMIGDTYPEMQGLANLIPGAPVFTPKMLATGQYHTCALSYEGLIYCWGRNDQGQLGLGNNVDRLAPVALNIGAGITATYIAAGGDHTCAILSDNTMKCWGSNSNGQLGMNLSSAVVAYYNDASSTLTNVTSINDITTVPLPPATTVDNIFLGAHHTCAQFSSDKQLRCWGLGTYGVIGSGSTADVGTGTTPLVSLVMAATQIGSGRQAVIGTSYGDHMCVVLDDARGKCWGRNDSEQLGIGTTTDMGSAVSQMGDFLPFLDL